MNNSLFVIERARAEDAAALLDYLKIVGGETENLSFCAQAAGKIKEADYILVHHQGSAYENAADEMDRLLKLKRTGFRSVQCKEGRYKVVCNDETEEK